MTTARDDAPRDPLPPPAASPPPTSPTPDFLHRFGLAIRGGASPSVAAEWAGVPRWTYKAWLKRKGEPYDTLRATQRSALAHLRVRLQAEIAKKHPERALRSLQVRDEQADEGRRYSQAPRPYTKAGQTLVQRALPYLTERVLDAAIPDTDLSPVEQAAPGADGLASRKHRRLFPVVEQRMRIADSLARQLQALGLDRAAPPVQSLHEYLAQRSTSEPSPVTPDDGEVSGQ